MQSDSPSEVQLVNQNYLLNKFPGKGGWTFATILEINKDNHAYFGLVKVKGSIDDFEINNYYLMSMGNGTMFLPVKAEIRKKIGKNEGDLVHIILYSEQLPQVNDEDFITCLKDETNAYQKFMKMSENEQEAIIYWIYSAKNDEIKVVRIAQTLDKLTKNF
jgi:hypothetical protein